MSVCTHCEGTLDDILHGVFSALLEQGVPVAATRGDTLELHAVALKLTNPLARLSRSEERRIVFSCLGELCWYLSGSDELAFIKPYIKRYEKEAVGGRVHSAYGPRLFGPPPADQVDHLIALLEKRPQSRQAVLQLFTADDLRHDRRDVPCTCSLQFLIRGGVLNLVTYMRSNDALYGLAHDVFCFTLLQEIMARRLGVELGTYYHFVGSLHFYTTEGGVPTKHRDTIERFINEGFQTSKPLMPPMPGGDPRPAIQSLLRAEVAARNDKQLAADELATLDPYWQDLVRLVQAYFIRGPGASDRIRVIQDSLANGVYKPYLASLAETRSSAS